jgi:hypothetical protein
MPFDGKGKYRDLLVAYVAGLTGLGFIPRSVLEVPPSESRLERLHTIIGECDSSILYPRFNMPFELGMVAGLRKPFFVFEEKSYRLQRTLSDVNGHDPKTHGGLPRRVLAGLRDLFQGSPVQPSLAALLKLLAKVETLARRIETEQGSLIGRQAFEDLVYGAQRLAKGLGLV